MSSDSSSKSEIPNPLFSGCEEEKCLVCYKTLGREFSTLTEKGWTTFKKHASEWSKITLEPGHEFYEFTQVTKRIEGKKTAFGKRHRSKPCRFNFSKKEVRDALLKGKKDAAIETSTSSSETPTTESESFTGEPTDEAQHQLPTPRTRSSTGNTTQFERICFICNIVRPCDGNSYNEGGLGICEFESAARKLNEAMSRIFESDELYNAKERLLILISGQSKDIYSAEIRYHRSCYRRFIYIKSSSAAEKLANEMHENALKDFLVKVELSIVHKGNAYLLNELLSDWLLLCEDRKVSPKINYTHHLKQIILKHFPKSIGFFRSGKFVIVYSQFKNPCDYSVETLKGCGMRKTDIITSFANMLKRNIPKLDEDSPSFPYTPKELISLLEKGPMPELYNTIFMTLHDSMTLNENGFAICNSSKLSCKIWSLSNDWEALLIRNSRYRNPKHVLSGTNISRIVQSKKVIQYLSKQNVILTNHDITRQVKKWEEMVIAGESGTTPLLRSLSTHSSIDNVDEETESISLHFTNSNLFQPNVVIQENDAVNVHVATCIEQSHPGSREEIPPYSIGKLHGPKPVAEFEDKESTELLQKRLSLDILWSVLSGIPDNGDDKLPMIGSWTHFNKQISCVKLEKTLQQYMPTVPHPVSDDAVLKAYLQFLLETTDNLEIQHIFTHCDEAVYSKLLHIIWNHDDKFKKVIPIMGGFHQLMCLQKVLYKRYGCLGIEKWVTGAGTTKSGSAAEKAVQGLHYNTTTRVYKEVFNAIIQMRTEDVTNNYDTIEEKLMDGLRELRKSVSSEKANNVLKMKEFHQLQDEITEATSLQSKMAVTFLKDISLMLSFTAAARESDIDLHLECERQFLKLAHAFDRINYSRWGSFQHITLSEMKRKSTDAYRNLKTVGFTASQTGGVFNAVHGDYICERQNAETKSAGGRLKARFMKNTKLFNRWTRTRHIAADMQNALNRVLKIKISSKHKDSTRYGIRKHFENVQKLKQLIRMTYRYDFFANGPVRAITTGKEIDLEVVNDLLSAATIGNECYQIFVHERLVTRNLSIFHKITKNKLKTGITKPPKTLKPVEVLKEDAQGFGVLAEQNIPLHEAFKHPITTLPLSIAESTTDLRSSGSKSKFRNDILKKTDATSYVHPTSAVWIYDVGKFVRSRPPEDTYQMFFDKLIQKMTPPNDADPLAVHYVIDKYIEDSTKSGTRKTRGESNSTRLYITGLGQAMPTTSDEWKSALSNKDTKNMFYSLFANYVTSGTAVLSYPTIINNEDNTFMIDPESGNISELFFCNHEEADTRMIYHASLQGTSNVVIVANDSDVLFLGSYACALEKSRKWYFNYEGNSYADLRHIADYFGDNALYLPLFHSLTGCDTTSYYHFRGKITPWERALKSPESFALIKELGKDVRISDDTEQDCIEFVRRYIYNGKVNEDLVGTKVRMYEDQVVKKTSTLPPDPSSVRYDILRKHHQAYTWRRCTEPVIEPLPFNECGWKKIDGAIVPIWYTCAQLPSCMSKYDKSGYQADTETSLNEDEVNSEHNEPPSKRFRRNLRNKETNNLKETDENIYLTDDASEITDLSDLSEWEHLSDFSDCDSSEDDSDWEL